jgi:NAD(P)H dehydrogenase (quinone)
VNQALVVVCHPDQQSFNHALASAAVTALEAGGFEVQLRDLYAEKFDPIISMAEMRGGAAADDQVRKHIDLLRSADLLVIVHPNCWGSPPAMMKGWMDRVFALDAAYAFEKGADLGGIPKGLLQTKAAVVFNTSNTSEERESRDFGDPLERIWRDCLLGYCGISTVNRKVFRIVATSSRSLRAAWLAEARELVEKTMSLSELK